MSITYARTVTTQVIESNVYNDRKARSFNMVRSYPMGADGTVKLDVNGATYTVPNDTVSTIRALVIDVYGAVNVSLEPNAMTVGTPPSFLMDSGSASDFVRLILDDTELYAVYLSNADPANVATVKYLLVGE